jgi:imidazolonepropionase-like amidohydrolase
MSLLIKNATVIDGVAEKPLERRSVHIEGSRINGIWAEEQVRGPLADRTIDADGKFVIAGLMNANVHLVADIRMESLVRHEEQYDKLIVEAAQVALKNGLTTVFDTWGPRRFLIEARDRINAGKDYGSRIYCAGNIVGIDGPFSIDFIAKTPELASADLIRKVESIWVESVGRRLMWLPPERVAAEVGEYIKKGIDFIKYASNDHAPGAFLAFSPRTQAAIVKEAHSAGITAQAHTLSVEGLWTALEADCDLIQHANITGPVQIPESTLELFVERNVAAVIFAYSDNVLDWINKFRTDMERTIWQASDNNIRRLIVSGAKLLFGNDGAVFPPDALTDPSFYGQFWARLAGEEDAGPYSLAKGHFTWLKVMESKGCAPMTLLRAVTRNIAEAYGVESELGIVQEGKLADLLVLDRNPLLSADNYESIHAVIKNGEWIDINALPTRRILTKPPDSPVAEEATYVPFFGTSGFPLCPMCGIR